MSDHVWVSKALSDTTSYRPLTNDLAETDKARAIESDRRNGSGEPLGSEYFPSRIWPSNDVPARKQPLGDLFFANSVWVVSKRCADIIGKFDLGAGSLYPVQLLEDDRMTVADTTYFCINFGNRITAILPDLSTGIRKTFNDYYRLKGVVNDDDIKLSAAAVSGPDLWIDPLLEGVLFLSDRLHAALSKAQVLKGFGDLKRCIVAQQN